MKSITSNVLKGAILLAAANVLLLLWMDSYDLRVGPIHLAAHSLFKPLLYLSAAVLAASLPASGMASNSNWSPSPLLAAGLTMALYLPFIGINPTTNIEWDHQISISWIHSIWDVPKLFVWRQTDGFYRPLTFFTFWLDQILWGEWIPGRHLQNIALHAANVILAVRLGLRYGMDAEAARWAGLILGVSALSYEPVLWPGARFDLLAALFTLAALDFALRYLDDLGPRNLACALALFVMGVLSKESAYCFPPLLFFFVWMRSKLVRAIPGLAATAILTVCLLALRFAIFGGLGGYPDASGVAPHFAIGIKTFTSFFNRALPASLFVLNLDAALGLVGSAAVGAFALWAAAQAFNIQGTIRTNASLVAAALLSALPAANLVDWIGPIAHNVRYIYLTSIWIFFLVASASRVRKLLAIFALANALGAIHNMQTFEWIDPAVRPVATELRTTPATP